MTKAERKVLDTVYEGLNKLSGLFPSNPADIKALAIASRKGYRVTGLLMGALSELKFGEIDSALESAQDAIVVLTKG